MLVVADSSPLVALVNIGALDLLPRLFSQVTITPLVARELAGPNRPPAVREMIGRGLPWLMVRGPTIVHPIPLLHAGEAEAINLACEIHADLLLIDEKNGRKAALDRGLAITGTVGVLELGATRGFINLEQAFGKLKQTDFWIGHQFLETRLRTHRQRQSGG